ncbi:MFS transporter [Hydrogenimonas cancrithermarum]|uniref:MFS transporter n=1 Tax=Hydrogenimonas cancrithermarum TaxID=2993563 RepID=A0ABN6WY44_9BACT|nr:MFS transporter [Hydrogenimonas cancrithermarum]BDY13095.1 MFS transporter [Hydrogenimonas cancrithermarum]
MFWRLSAFYLFYFAIIGVYVIFFPKALQMAGYSSAQIGVLLSAAPLMRFLVPFFFLKHIKLDRKSYTLSLIILSISVLLFYPALEHFKALLAVNLLFGASISISLPFVEARALEVLDRHIYGRSRLFGSIGFMLIALWLGKVLETPLDALHYLLGTTLMTTLSGLAIVYGLKPHHAKSEKKGSGANFSILRFWPLWLSFFLMQVSFGGFYNFFTIYETSHGIGLEMTSWLWSFGVICEIAMLYFQGPLLHKNLLVILQITIAVTALRWMLLWLFPDSLAMTFATQSLHALGFALYHSASITLLYSLYRQKALAQQFFLGISYGLGGFVGAILAGQIYGEYLFLIESMIALTAFSILKLQKGITITSNRPI